MEKKTQKQKKGTDRRALIVCTGDRNTAPFRTPPMPVAAVGAVVSRVNCMRDRSEA